MAAVVATPKPALDKPLMHYGHRVLDRTAPGSAETEYRILGISPLTPTSVPRSAVSTSRSRSVTTSPRNCGRPCWSGR